MEERYLYYYSREGVVFVTPCWDVAVLRSTADDIYILRADQDGKVVEISI